VLKVTALEQGVVMRRKDEKAVSSLVLTLARNGHEIQLPVVAVAVLPLVAEPDGLAPYNVGPIPS
jgi:hypothetical protein